MNADRIRDIRCEMPDLRPSPIVCRLSYEIDPSRVRGRAVLIACPLILLDNLWVVWMERVARGPYVTTISLFGNAVFLLAVLVGMNALLRGRAPRLALSQAEMLLIYSMVAMGAAFAGLDMVSILIQMITHPIWFTNSPGLSKYLPYLPRPVMVTDRKALIGFFNGS